MQTSIQQPTAKIINNLILYTSPNIPGLKSLPRYSILALFVFDESEYYGPYNVVTYFQLSVVVPQYKQ